MIWCGKMEYITGSVVFNDWIITREIGQGATGKVFEIEKSGYGITVKSALKVIRIPKSPSDIQAVRNEGMTMESVEDYFREFVDEILREVRIMVSLKEHPNIVSYEDHCVVPHESEVGWDVLIKMELLTPLSEWQGTHQMDEQTVIRLGKEISSALAYAAEHDLIHRDVKPENIFVNEAGKFKLGDFGIARTIEKTTGGLSKKGTESYMAPEVYHGNPYSRQVDIYSLGIVLYRFLNENRLPFYPPAPQVIKYSDRETAIIKRMSGMELPEPKNGSTEIKRIVQKACQYLPEKRYATMNELFNDLQQCNSTGNESKWTAYQKSEEQQQKIQKTEEKNPPKQNQKEENGDAVVSRIQEEYAEPIKEDKQEALHTKKQKGISKKHGKFTAKKVLITCILAGVVAYGFLLHSIIQLDNETVKEMALAVAAFIILCFVSNKLINSRYFQKKRSGNNEISDSAIHTMMNCAKQVIEMVAAGNQKEEIVNIIPELRQSGEIVESAIDTWKRNIKVHYGTYKQILEQNVTVNKYDVTVTSNCEFENGEVIITFEFRENFCMTKVEFIFSGIQEEYTEPIIVDKQEALHTKKQKDTSKKNEKFKVRKVVITCILAVVVSCGILFYMQGEAGSLDSVFNMFHAKKQIGNYVKNGDWYYVKADNQDIRIAIRLEPAENAEARTWLTRGTQVYIEEYSNNWGYTVVDGISGWVNMDYLSKMETGKLEEKHEYSIIAEIALRKEPSEDSERIGTLYRGATVLTKKRSGNWGYTEIDGQPCWFSLKYARLVE